MTREVTMALKTSILMRLGSTDLTTRMETSLGKHSKREQPQKHS